ncbi:unnamed protein product [Notodromas monacha]|uniref:Uncharacterized protein n=1 Tax=Notodromas monacha TaxID=399045 RepID=A0A7R9G9S6_9CRUS|nr:unnamed protein product [Notodromas monacha]CAG0913258.1 unnamed protein product [Notodromas monacha]
MTFMTHFTPSISTFQMCVLHSQNVPTEIAELNRNIPGNIMNDVNGVEVKVTVVDKNDTPPSWDGHPSVFAVSEDLSPGQAVATVRAVDADSAGHITYEFVTKAGQKPSAKPEGTDVFAVDPSRGVVSLLRPLDREQKAEYAMVVRAKDGVQFSDFDIVIKVTDTNDNAPQFDEPRYSIEVDEDEVRGAVVGSVHAGDADEGANGLVSYSVISDWANDVFSLNPVTGVFTLASRLDYEQVQHYIFVVEAKDAGTPSLSSTVSVYFNVMDLNDNAPVFDPMSFSDRVYENTTVGAPVLTVAATDQDSGLNGKLEYTLEEEGDENDPTFGIHGENGTIFTRKELDRERRSTYNLVVIATDLCPDIDARLSSSIQVTIIVEDVNDVVPEFVGPTVGSVTENAPPNTVVMAVKAKDADEGRNSYVEYFLERGVGSEKFEMGAVDGLIRVRGSLDREATPYYRLEIVARDRGSPSLSASTTVTVQVLDANDNAPMFDPRHYSATVPENATIGLSVLQVSATDLDSELNARIRYAIVDGDASRDFMIAEDSGVIRVAKTLNFENHPHYVITVQAEDSGQEVMYDSATVSITVTDMNDNAPLFLDSPYVIYVREQDVDSKRSFSETDARIGRVTAYDADGPPHNRITYLLKDGDKDKFAIDMNNGEIKLKSGLDRETQSDYELVIAAMDSGTPRLTGTGTVRIIVTDINDHGPVFDTIRYVARVAENAPIATSVVSIRAKDADDGLNGRVVYSLLENEGKFGIDEITGIVVTTAELDREERDEYALVVAASDSALSDSRTSYANLTVVVTDVNDNAPKFLSDVAVARVPDPLEQGTFVFGCEVVDADAGENGTMFYYLDGPDADLFTVNEDTGIVTAARKLTSLQNGKKFSFDLVVADKGEPGLTSVRTIDVYLHPGSEFPECDEFPDTVSFSEDEPIGTKAGKTRAKPKSGDRASLAYRIIAGNNDRSFAVDATNGEIFVSNRLDHESRAFYELWVEARDSGLDPQLGTVVRLAVNVTDVNDNAPVFEEFVYNAAVMEAEAPPKLVAKVSAVDADTGENKRVTYRIDDRSASVSPIFEIDPVSGEIHSKIELDRERVDKYSFVVEAVDHGDPQKTGTSVVVVTVVDKNDNPPRFTRLFSVNVTENAPIGTFVIQVTSSDKDIGANGNATYSFTENPGGKFRIDGASGNVTVAAPIDREARAEYSLKVSAVDGSWRAETPLTITVLDENDNAPVFESPHYAFSFPETDANVTDVSKLVVGVVRATDKDKAGPNSALSYSLKHPSDFFAVDPGTGRIFPKRAVVFEGGATSSPENEYSVQVVAVDQGKPPMSSECTVGITVVKANKSPPKFLREAYSSPVPETALFAQRVVQISAVDADFNAIDSDRMSDEGEDTGVTYETVGGNGTQLFGVEAKSGWIVTSQPLLGRRNSVYDLVVRATDNGIPPLFTEVRVTLVLTGQNRFAPVFTSTRPYVVAVEENAALGKPIVTLTATDDDGADNLNGAVRYFISAGNERGKFAINARSGTITVAESLDYDAISRYVINVTATDSGFLQNSAETAVIVSIVDVNDNAPVFVKGNFEFHIEENFGADVLVGKVEARDADSSPFNVIRYSIKDQKAKESFKINPETGEIYATKSFDYEETSRFDFLVTAWNPDAPDTMVSSSTVAVLITGENEFYPKFVQPSFHFTVSESARIGEVAGKVRAVDSDAGADGQVYYLLVGSSNDRGFYVEKDSGNVVVSRRLDREIQSRVVLTVLAKNGGSILGNDTDEAQVVVSIEDGNDPPAFTREIYSKTLQEDADVGTVVLAVKAVDKDVNPDNNQFTYTMLKGNVDKAFNIHPISGVVQLVGKLDRETTHEYDLVVGAVDTGNPPETGTATVRIVVADANDNAPEFDTQEILGYVTENRPAGTSVLVLRPFDRDGDKNGAPFTFNVVSGDDDVLAVNPRTGVVRTAKVLDREAIAELRIDVQVEDSGSPRLKSVYPVKVQVLDENDTPSTPRSLDVRVFSLGAAFPGGKIADVRPNDADSTGNYNCRLVSNAPRLRMFSIPSGCDLHMSTVDTDVAQRLSIIGNDGRHPDVTSSVNVKFRSLPTTVLPQSSTLRITNITSTEFLAKFHDAFVDVVQNILAFGQQLLVFSVVDRTDSGVSEVRVSVSVESAEGFSSPSRALLDTKHRLAQLFGAKRSLTLDYDPCRKNPCKNDGACAVTGVDGVLKSAFSPSLGLTGPEVAKDFTCQCRAGFEGKVCDIRRDPCFPNPCLFDGVCSGDRSTSEFTCRCPEGRQGKRCEKRKRNACEEEEPCKNGGSCRTTDDDAGFFCLCRAGYRGRSCEVTSESCRPNPCLNGGTCMDLKPGYKCQCAPNYFGAHCAESSFGFSSLSYMTFGSLDATTNDVSITFSTNKPNGLLLYNFGLQTGGRSDFVAVEIVGGRPRFSYGGARTAISSIALETFVADGRWYKVTATRNSRVMSLSVGNCSHEAGASLVCRECRDTGCYVDDTGTIGTLNFNGKPLFVGGVDSMAHARERPGQILADDFVGCVESLMINGRSLNLSAPTASRGISDTCNRRQVCSGGDSDPCAPRGVCLDHWDRAVCKCDNGLTAPDCGDAFRPISLAGNGFVEFKVTESLRRRHIFAGDDHYNGAGRWRRQSDATATGFASTTINTALSFKFRTVDTSGVLLHATSAVDYTLIYIQEGALWYSSKLGENFPVNMSLSTGRYGPLDISDGSWHNLTLILGTQALTFELNGNPVGDELDPNTIHNFIDPYLTSLTFGGTRDVTLLGNEADTGFQGCLSSFVVAEQVQVFNGTGVSMLDSRFVGHVDFGCSAAVLGAAAATDPLSIGVTLVIVFFVALLVAILVSFVVFRFRRRTKRTKSPRPVHVQHHVNLKQNSGNQAIRENNNGVNGNGVGVVQQASAPMAPETTVVVGRHHVHQDSGYVENGDMLGQDDGIKFHLAGKKMRELPISESVDGYGSVERFQPQTRPDLLESRESVNKSPGGLSYHSNGLDEHHMLRSRELLHMTMGMDMGISEPAEHYDLENASSIAPSDIDIIYHYRGYRDGNVRKYHHKPGRSPLNFPGDKMMMRRQSPGLVPVTGGVGNGVGNSAQDKMQSTPLARLSPSSELSQQTGPRILTLQDISGKPLQRALLAASPSRPLNSERSMNSPVSHLTSNSSTTATGSYHSSKKPPPPPLAPGPKLVPRPRNSSLVSALDDVSTSSDERSPRPRRGKFSVAPSPATVDKAPHPAVADSSTDESGNDSFTCSEFEYDGYEKPDGVSVAVAPPSKGQTETRHVPATFRGSLSTLVASDDDSSFKATDGAQWEYFLDKWTRLETFQNMVGVFTDIAALPDSSGPGEKGHATVSAVAASVPPQNHNEEYV